MPATAVVFAYHDVGVRCLPVLLEHGVKVPLVVTHRDDPNEIIWFASVEKVARSSGIAVEMPDDPNLPAFVERLRATAPDFIFSFYYRHMLSPAVLATAKRGAFNMHGSLLPKYRGRVPINWAIINGERETGATLHEMVERPDAGRIAARQSVPILDNDLAVDVFGKVVVAATHVLDRALPAILDGTVRLEAQDLSKGSYYGGRKPEDGRIDWTRTGKQIHDLIRAVAPPYPGAFTTVGGKTVRLLRSTLSRGEQPRPGTSGLVAEANGHLRAVGADGVAVDIQELEFDGQRLTPQAFCDKIGSPPARG